MKKMNILFASLIALATVGCSKNAYTIPQGSDSVPTESSKVTLTKNDLGQWKLIVNEAPYYVNGAAANRFYTDVRRFGGNTIRLYSPSPSDTRTIMDEAYQAGLKVFLGLGMAAAQYFDYSNAEKVADQKEKISGYVKQFMNHPALLCWAIGNEMEASNEDNIPMWQAIGDVAAMIRKLDPNHPITNVLASSAQARIRNLTTYAPDIDFISVNTYYPNVGNVADNIAAVGVDMPFMVTEFGPRGTWAMGSEASRILPWSDNFSASSKALVEETSTEKEAIYLKVWNEDIKAREASGCLGSFVFVWGYQTHGEVLNWYSFYTTDKYTYGVCDAMQKCWTGSYPEVRAPRIESRSALKMNGKVAEDAVTVKPGSSNTAKVTATAAEDVNLRYHWIIFKEGDKKEDGSMPDGIEGLIAADGAAEVSFKAPASAGAYRLYVFALDDVHKKAASACIPFLVSAE